MPDDIPNIGSIQCCHFGVRLHKGWLSMIDEVFGDHYHEELMIERQYWMYQTL